MTITFNTNLEEVSFRFLNILKAPVTKKSFFTALRENPFYPSLYSLSQTLDRFNIPNTALQIEKTEFDKLPLPFVAYIRNRSTGNDFVAVTVIKNDILRYTADGKKQKEINKNEFLNDFLGVVLLAEINNNSGEPGFIKKRKNELNGKLKKIVLLTLGGILLLTALFHFAQTSKHVLFAVWLYLVEIAGVLTSTMLLIYEVDKNNSFIKHVCSIGKSKTNCDAVLNSNASKFIGIPWSEIGYYYFSALLLFSLSPFMSFNAKLAFIGLFFLAAVLYIPFSIIYQYKIAKQWCPLCIIVQVILLNAFILGILFYASNGFQIPLLNAATVFSFGVSVTIPIFIWGFLKPLLIKAREANVYEGAYKRLLYNPDIFNSFLQQQPGVAQGWEHMGINLGNEQAENTIIKVCNPYCTPCAMAHPVLEDVVEKNKNIKLKIIFTCSNPPDDNKSKPVLHLLMVAKKNNKNETKQALNEWYVHSNKDYEAFAEKYPLNTEWHSLYQEFDAMKKWCDETSITHTPTIFVNGKRLPETYNIEELKNIL
jgi:uncharacterized membrane protein